jgi:4-hydroxybenzoate polyprenyltransferase
MKAHALPALVRPFTLLAPAVGVGSAAAIVLAATEAAFDAATLALGVASALLATAASNAWNQAYDVEIDRINKPRRPVPAGDATVGEALLLGHAAAAGALLCGWLASPGFFACVLAGTALTFLYSAPPLRLKCRPVGALVAIAIARGVLVPVAGWALFAPVDTPEPWSLGVVVGLFVLGAAATKDFADVEGDREHGSRTLPILLGPHRAARVIAPFLVLPFLLYPAAAHAGLLSPSPAGFWVLAAALAALGLFAAVALLRAPAGESETSGNHPAWAAMYLLMLGAHVGTAIVYQATGTA